MLIINKIYHQSTGAILLTEDKALTSRIAQLHYEFYEEKTALIEELKSREEEIQCIVSDVSIGDLKVIPYGKAQAPTLTDYSDGVDIMAFLTAI